MLSNVLLNVNLVKKLKLTVNLVVSTDLKPQPVNVTKDTSKRTKNVTHVIRNVLPVLAKLVVLNVLETE